MQSSHPWRHTIFSSQSSYPEAIDLTSTSINLDTQEIPHTSIYPHSDYAQILIP
jgi:hypothetical protein